jgi:hypothetical protein
MAAASPAPKCSCEEWAASVMCDRGRDGFIYIAFDGRNGEPTGIVRLEPAGNSGY